MNENDMMDDGELITGAERLAGGIAHACNNVLMIVSARARFALEELPEGDDVRVHVEEIAQAAERAKQLTRQLLAFAQKQALRPERVDIGGLVGGMERQLRVEAGPRTELRLSLADDCSPAFVDRAQISQVLLNLVANAREAMPAGGRLDVSVANVTLDAEAGVPAGSYVRLRVADTGHGMDAATRARIFEPFFTTRESGRGAGLGLSVVQGVVRQSRGFLRVASAPGEGATFDVYLPCETAAIASPTQTPAARPAASPRADAAPVLVCDDEPQVRATIAAVLRRLGYTVVEARNGPEALLLAEVQRVPLQLLVTDLEMPEMSGEALADQLIERFPELRVLYVSGYIDDSLTTLGDPDAGVVFLEKPFTAGEFARRVEALMQGAAVA